MVTLFVVVVVVVVVVAQRFCAFGGNAGAKVMDNKTFAKLCKDTRLVHKKNKRFTTTDVDLIFAKVKAKGKRKITFSEFETALSAIGTWQASLLANATRSCSHYLPAAKLYPKLGSEEALHNVEDQIIAGGGPSSSGTVRASPRATHTTFVTFSLWP